MKDFASPNKIEDETSVTRRSFLLSLASGVCGAVLGGCGGAQRRESNARQLNIYSWADYIHPKTIPEFQRRYGIEVVYDTFSSNESLLAKMQAGATQYDVIVPTSYMVTQLRKLSLLAEIDHARLPLLGNVMERFQNPAFDPGLRYCVPYTWGTTGIGFDANAFASENDWPTDWNIFWNEKLRGRITLLDDARESIGMALKRRGYSYNTHKGPDIVNAAGDLKSEKPLVMCYTSDQVIVQLAAGDSALALAFSGDVYQAAAANRSIRYVIPRSGASLWLDNLCLPRTTPHVDNAYKWLNFLLEPEIAAANAAHTRYATPNRAALKFISKELLGDSNLYPSEQLLSRCEELGDIGSLVFLYDRLWTELKCS